MIRQALVIASFILSSAVAQAAGTARQAGTYVLLLDEAGKPVAGAYWLSPALKMSLHSKEAGSPSDPIFVDREFFPSRQGRIALFDNLKLSYAPDPATLAIGASERIVRRSERVGRFAGESSPEELPLRYTFTGVLASTLDGFDLINRFYSLERYDLSENDDRFGKRVYVETLDIDMSADEGARVAGIEMGPALSSGDFYIDYLIRSDAIPQVTKCLQEKRVSADYKANARRQRDGSDMSMATVFLTEGRAYWEQDEFVPEEKAMSVYSLCPSP